jgi:hypothetical protein
MTQDAAPSPDDVPTEAARRELEAATLQLASGNHLAAARAFERLLEREPPHPIELGARLLRGVALARQAEAGGGAAELTEIPPSRAGSLLSFIVCSIDPQRFERVSANIAARFREVEHEIVGIHDARSLCEGYNRGVARSRGEILVFCHDDIEIVSPDAAGKLLGSFGDCQIVGIVGTRRLTGPSWGDSGWPEIQGQVHHPWLGPGVTVAVYGLAGRLVSGAQAADGMFFAAVREVCEELAFDELAFDGWHLYDLDFTFGAFLRGYSVAVRTDLLLRHASMGADDDARRRYAARFAAKYRAALSTAGPPGPVGGLSVRFRSDEEWRCATEWALRKVA